MISLFSSHFPAGFGRFRRVSGDAMMRDQNAAVHARTKAQNRANVMKLKMVDAVVYLVDANDKERFSESKKKLNSLLLDESLPNVLFLIMGNKIDKNYPASEDELRYYLCITGLTTGKGTFQNLLTQHCPAKSQNSRKV